MDHRRDTGRRSLRTFCVGDGVDRRHLDKKGPFSISIEFLHP